MPRELARGGSLLVVVASLIFALHAVAQSARSQLWSSAIEPNRGQTAGWAEYVFHSRSYDAFIRGGTILLRSRSKDRYQASADLQLEFRGSRNSLLSKPIDTLPGRTNYLLGTNPGKWIVNLPRYSGIRYLNLYPSIELIYDATRENLEYKLRLLSGADPDLIRLKVESGYRIHVDQSGSLVLTRGEVRFVLPPPEAHQRSARSLRHVDVAYELCSDNEVRFRLGTYDRSVELTIDPYVVYATYLGGFDPLVSFNAPNGEGATGITADAAGNAYIVGQALPNFPVTPGAFQTTPSSQQFTAFVAKVDPQGKLVYSTFVSGLDGGQIAVDADGNVYCAGPGQPSLPVTAGSYRQEVGSTAVIKLNSSGNALVYATYLGGSGLDTVGGVALDSSRNLFIAGTTSSNDFPVVAGVQNSLAGGNDGFVTKLNASGSALVYSTYLGGTADDQLNGIGVDSAGDAIVAGSTRSSDFPTAQAFQTSCAEPQGLICEDGVLAKLDPSGTKLLYSTFFGGTKYDNVTGIAVDSLGRPVIAGITSSTDLPLANSLTSTPGPGFVTMFNADASALVFSTYFGGGSPSGVAIDGNGNISFTGTSVDLSILNAFDSQASALFVASLAPAGASLRFSSFVGSTPFRLDYNYQAEIAVDGSGNIYLAGYTYGLTTVNPLQPLPGGGINGSDAFIFKISPDEGAALGLAPAVVSFGNQPLNTTSATQEVFIRDLGTTALNLSSVTVSGDFEVNNNCGVQVSASGGSCSLSISFTPTTVGTRHGMVTIADSAGGSPHTIPLTGVGAVPAVVLQPSALTFGVGTLGTPSASQSVTLTDSGGATLTISRIQASGDFGETNNCGTTLSAGSACSIDVTFTPTADGVRTGMLSISDNAADSPQSINLVGGVTPDFSISATTISATISAGGNATYDLSVVGNTLFSGTIQSTCKGAPALATCTVSPNSANVSANGSVNLTVAVTTTATRMAALGGQALSGATAALGIFLLVPLRRRKRIRLNTCTLLLLTTLVVFGISCGSGSTTRTVQQGTPAGSYKLTVTVQSPSASHDFSLQLQVQ